MPYYGNKYNLYTNGGLAATDLKFDTLLKSMNMYFIFAVVVVVVAAAAAAAAAAADDDDFDLGFFIPYNLFFCIMAWQTSRLSGRLCKIQRSTDI